jgi:NAD-reducing hydrogenase large subunit
LHAAEVIAGLLADPALLGDELVRAGPRRHGRGHHRGAARDADPPLRGRRRRPGDDVQPHRLHDAQQPGDERGDPPGRAQYLDGHEPTEGLLNHIEVAIRAFDPCLSCATHALGKMPLAVEIVDAAGAPW